MKWTPGTQNDDVDDERGNVSSGGDGDGSSNRSYGGSSDSDSDGWSWGWQHFSGGGLVVALLIIGGIKIYSHFEHHGANDDSSIFHAPHPNRVPVAGPRTGPDPDTKLVDFIKFVWKDLEDTWEGLLKNNPDGPFRHAKLVLFTSEISTGCGRSSSAIGPFYCGADEKAYIDLSFYKELRDKYGGSNGEFSEAYVLAHELGHHIQKIIGLSVTKELMGNDKKTKLEREVRQELQADCYAGLWGHSANERKLLEVGDVDQALKSASSIGDDRIQKLAHRPVNPETWTHGSSEQRVKWFKKGFEGGKLSDCDTFGPAPP